MKDTTIDNCGRPKSDYITNLQAMTDESLFTETADKIWLSAYANNNPRSDYHWKCDECYNECQRREKPEIYKQAYKSCEP